MQSVVLVVYFSSIYASTACFHFQLAPKGGSYLICIFRTYSIFGISGIYGPSFPAFLDNARARFAQGSRKVHFCECITLLGPRKLRANFAHTSAHRPRITVQKYQEFQK